MKLIYISNGYPPHRWAGTETYTAGLADGFAQRGNQVQVLCVGRWRDGADYWNGYADDVYHGVSVRRLNLNWKKSPDPFTYLYNNPIIADYFKGYLNEFKPDLVHVTSCETLSASVLEVVKNSGVPLVLSLTDFWFLCPRINLLRSDGSNCDGNTTAWECLRCKLWKSKAYRYPSKMLPEHLTEKLLTTLSSFPVISRQRGLRGMAGDMSRRKSYLKKALGWPDLRITASAFVRQIYISNGVKHPIKVQSYGHDLSWLESYPGKRASETIRFGYIGQLIESKGVHVLLQAAKSIPQELQRRYSIVVFGNLEHDPGYSQRLHALSAGMENVHYGGIYPHEESGKIFSDIDVLVVPSLWYDFPLVIYEAFATKTPVIATGVGGMAEAISYDVSGLLFPRGDAGELSKQMEKVLTEPGLLERLQAGVPTVKTVAEEIDNLETIYREYVENTKYTTTRYREKTV